MQLGREIDACLMPRTPLAIFLREVRVRQSAEKPEPGRRKGNDRERRGGRPFLKYDSPYNHNTHTHTFTEQSLGLFGVRACVLSLLDLFPVNCGRKKEISAQTQARIMIVTHDDPPKHRHKQTH